MTDLAFNVAKRPRAGLRTLILVVLLSSFSVTGSRPAEAREVVHQVQKGQYLDLIARRYHTTAAAIAKRNGLRPGKMLKPGDKLVIIETDEHRQWREAVERATGKRVKEREHQPDPPEPAPAKPEPAKAAPKPKAPPRKLSPRKLSPRKLSPQSRARQSRAPQS
ncbi:MAG: LysM domain-containing protein [Polyangiaceae bacterium]